MSEPIGYQDGIAAFIGWLRKQAGVPKRGIGYDKADLSTWPWPDKLERTLRILKDEHDAAVPSAPPETVPPPPPPPTPKPRLAPRTYNKVLPDGSDARFCKQASGVTVHGDGSFDDEGGNHYDANGLLQSGPRDPNFQVPGLNLANNMNGRDPCDPYGPFPPWPDKSYEI